MHTLLDVPSVSAYMQEWSVIQATGLQTLCTPQCSTVQRLSCQLFCGSFWWLFRTARRTYQHITTQPLCASNARDLTGQCHLTCIILFVHTGMYMDREVTLGVKGVK